MIGWGFVSGGRWRPRVAGGRKASGVGAPLRGVRGRTDIIRPKILPGSRILRCERTRRSRAPTSRLNPCREGWFDSIYPDPYPYP